MRILANELNNFIGKSVTVEGWVNSRRDHGGLIFIDLRDYTGIIQLVITPENKNSFELAETLRDEFVIKATGEIREREQDLINPNIETGKIELVIDAIELLNKSEPLPVNTHDDGEKSSEEMRLKYRYLDLRRPSMQKILQLNFIVSLETICMITTSPKLLLRFSLTPRLKAPATFSSPLVFILANSMPYHRFRSNLSNS